MGFISMCARAAAGLALLIVPALATAQGYDAIGGSSASSNGNNFLSSTSNSDNGADFWTAAGVGAIAIAPGHRVNGLDAVIGVRGAQGVGPINFSAVAQWEVHIWSSLAAFAAAPKAGDVFSRVYAGPENPGFSTPYGVDADGQPTFLVKFTMPGGITGLTSGSTYYFAVRAKMSYSTVGYIGILESSATGPSGVQAGWAHPAPGYVFFNNLTFVKKHGGVLAYRVREGCRADFNADGQVNIDDIFIYLNAWFSHGPGSDFDGVNGTSIDDIFVFLNQWFTGC